MAYLIKIETNYYAGTINAPGDHFLKPTELPEEHPGFNRDDYNIFSFETEESAQLVIDILKDGVCYLAHGQAADDTLSIVIDDDIYDIPDCVDCSDYDNFGALIDLEDIPQKQRKELENCSVDYQSSDSTTTDYTNQVNSNTHAYTVCYCVNNIKIDICGGELDAINWDKPSYFVAEL